MGAVLNEPPAADMTPAARRDEIIALLFAGLARLVAHRAAEAQKLGEPSENVLELPVKMSLSGARG